MNAEKTVDRNAFNVTAKARVVLIGLVLVGLLLIQEPVVFGG